MIERADLSQSLTRKEALVQTWENRQRLFDELGSGEIKPQVSERKDELAADLQTIRLRALIRKSLARLNSRIESLELIIQEESQRSNLIRSRLETMRSLVDPANPDTVSLSIIQKWELELLELASQGVPLRAQEPQPKQLAVAPEIPAAPIEPTIQLVENKEELPFIDLDEQQRKLSLSGESVIKLSPVVTKVVAFFYNHPNEQISTQTLEKVARDAGLKGKNADLSIKLHRIEKRLGRKIFMMGGKSWKTTWSLPRKIEEEVVPVEKTEQEVQRVKAIQEVINAAELTPLERRILLIGSIYSETNLGYNYQWRAEVYGENPSGQKELAHALKKFMERRKDALGKVADKIEIVTVWPEGHGLGKKSGHYLKLKEPITAEEQAEVRLLTLTNEGARFGAEQLIYLNEFDLANLTYLSQHPEQVFSTNELRALLPQKLNQVDLSDTLSYVEKKIGRKIFIRVGQGRKTKYQWPTALPAEVKPVQPTVDLKSIEKQLTEVYNLRDRIKEKTRRGAYDRNWLPTIDERLARLELELGRLPSQILEVDPEAKYNLGSLLYETQQLSETGLWDAREINSLFQISPRALEAMIKAGELEGDSDSLNSRQFTISEVIYIRYKLRSSLTAKLPTQILKMTIDHLEGRG